VHPQQLAGSAIQRHGVAMLAGGGIEHAIHEQGCRLEIEIRTRTEAFSAKAPCDLQGTEVGAIDLIERGIARGAKIAAPGSPFAVGCSALRRCDGGDRARGGDAEQPSRRSSKPCQASAGE
jgi:hypothetical protein